MREKRETEDRLDFMADLAQDLGPEDTPVGACPRCAGDLVGRKADNSSGGTSVMIRCLGCDYVFVHRA